MSKKLTSTVIIDKENFKQWPRFVDLLIRDGQTIPEDLKQVSEVRNELIRTGIDGL